MNHQKRGRTSSPYHEEYKYAKKAKLVSPKILKPVPSYYELKQFNLEFRPLENRYRYDWFRGRCDNGRSLCLQHEPFNFGYQPRHQFVCQDAYEARRRALPPFHLHQDNNGIQQSRDSANDLHNKTRIFKPSLQVESTIRQARGSLIHEKERSESDRVNEAAFNTQRGQIEYGRRSDVFGSKTTEVRPKQHDNKHSMTKVTHKEASEKTATICCNNDYSKDKNLSANSSICCDEKSKEKLSSTHIKSAGSVEVAEDEELSSLTGEGSDDRISEVRCEGKNKKVRRKAFTVASTLMEKIIESPVENSPLENAEVTKKEKKTDTSKETRNGEEVACKVFGLLSLQGSRERRYEITVEELRRRVSAPEHLNKVDMISYLRLAKNSARLLLEKFDIISSLHHRLSKHTILSKVSEKECEDLACGIHDINMSYFPFRITAQKSVSKLKETETISAKERENLKKRYQDLETARSVLMEMYGNLNSLQDSKELNDFKKITHTFGVQNLSNHIEFFDKCFKEEEKLIIDTLKND